MKCPSCDADMEPTEGATFTCPVETCGYRWPVPPAHRYKPAADLPQVGQRWSCSVMPHAPQQPVEVVSSFIMRKRPVVRYVVEDKDGRLYIVTPAVLEKGRRL